MKICKVFSNINKLSFEMCLLEHFYLIWFFFPIIRHKSLEYEEKSSFDAYYDGRVENQCKIMLDEA
jgi:hypothetical protein